MGVGAIVTGWALIYLPDLELIYIFYPLSRFAVAARVRLLVLS
jgi:hypothetical protein